MDWLIIISLINYTIYIYISIQKYQIFNQTTISKILFHNRLYSLIVRYFSVTQNQLKKKKKKR